MAFSVPPSLSLSLKEEENMIEIMDFFFLENCLSIISTQTGFQISLHHQSLRQQYSVQTLDILL